MKKFVAWILIAIMAVTLLVGCSKIEEHTSVERFEVGDIYQLSNGDWIYFSSEGAVEIGR